MKCAMVDAVQSLYRRPLPPALIAFASPEGRQLFDEARRDGGMEAFFPLIEQFHTQADPAFCGLGSLVVALNALGVDPGRLWRGPWRWFSEELLDCCTPLERVRAQGITIDEFACLARCNGAEAEVFRPDRHDEDALRRAILAAAVSSTSPLIVSYARAGLDQTGGGHFSPIGGYHRGSDRALILDVARFKYPPHWVPVARLHAAMAACDPITGRPRGWVRVGRSERPASLLFSARWIGAEGPEALDAALSRMRATIASTTIVAPAALIAEVVRASERLPIRIEARALAEADQPEHVAAAGALRCALHDTALFALVAAAIPSSIEAEAWTLLALALPAAVWTSLPAAARERWAPLVERERLPAPVRAEVIHLADQLQGLCALGLAGACVCS